MAPRKKVEKKTVVIKKKCKVKNKKTFYGLRLVYRRLATVGPD